MWVLPSRRLFEDWCSWASPCGPRRGSRSITNGMPWLFTLTRFNGTWEIGRHFPRLTRGFNSEEMLMTDSERAKPPRAVPLSAAIAALRDELTRAWWDGRKRTIRFKPAPVELDLQVAVTTSGTLEGEVKWWVVGLGGSFSEESVVTQSLKVTLEPVMPTDDGSEPSEFLIEAAEEDHQTSTGLDVDLEAAE